MKPLPRTVIKGSVLSWMFAALDDDRKMTKHTVAKNCRCHPDTAARYLSLLHQSCIVRVCGWVRRTGGPIPKYELHNGRADATRPQKMTEAQKQQRYRKNNPDIISNQTASKYIQKHLFTGKIRLGVWGL